MVTTEPSSDSDDDILALARDVCLKMQGYAKFSPRSVSWETQPESRYTPPFLVRSDMPYIKNDRLVLPLTMRGRLTPEEWRPLIASSLVHYYSKARRRANKIEYGRFLFAFTIVVSYFVTGPLLYGPTPNPAPRVWLIGFDGVLFSMGALVVYANIRFWHVMWFMSDRLSCRMLGDKRSMLEVLNKIRAIHPVDVERVEKSRFPFARPRISQRITHLSKQIHY